MVAFDGHFGPLRNTERVWGLGYCSFDGQTVFSLWHYGGSSVLQCLLETLFDFAC